jgi:hypothetical protein
MTTAVSDRAPRVQVLPSGVRFVRLEPGDEGWLVEYEQTLRLAAEDFLKRAHLPGTVDGVLQELAASLAHPARAVWLVLWQDYRCIGFAIAEVSAQFGGPRTVLAVATYLRTKWRAPRAVFPALVAVMLAWGASLGATVGQFWTRRTEARAWARVGAQPTATIYTVPIAAPEGA